MDILIADDDKVIRFFMEKLLEKAGHKPVVCSDGKEVMTILTGINPPKMAILDWIMPGYTGPEICHEIRKNPALAATYVILLTSKNDQDDIIEGLNSGANDYIKKPFNKPELELRINIGIKILELQQENALLKGLTAVKKAA